MWDPKSPWADQRVRLAANYAHRPPGTERSGDAGRLAADRATLCRRPSSLRCPLSHIPTIPPRRSSLLAEAGYPNGFDAGDLYPWPPYFSAGEAITNYLQAVGIKTRLRTMERAAFYSALGSRSSKGCACA